MAKKTLQEQIKELQDPEKVAALKAEKKAEMQAKRAKILADGNGHIAKIQTRMQAKAGKLADAIVEIDRVDYAARQIGKIQKAIDDLERHIGKDKK